MTALVVEQQTIASTRMTCGRTTSARPTALAQPNDLRAWPLTFAFGPIGALLTAPGLCRGLVGWVTREWGLEGISETAVLLVSELATNVVQEVHVDDPADEDHGRLPVYDENGRLPVFRLGLFSNLRRFRIEVFDSLPGGPVQGAPGLDDEAGRGLFLVDTLARKWGVDKYSNGKAVWCELEAA